jgi:alpha-aminoadipate/glutamate carrier protein LysW
MGTCPECGKEIENTQYELGEIIECPECGVELEITSTEPFQFSVFEEEEK